MPKQVIIVINTVLSILVKEEMFTLRRQGTNPHDNQSFSLSQSEVEDCLEAAEQWFETQIKAKEAELEEADGTD